MAKKDNIYKVGNFNDLPFSFNEEVAEVFEDMIDRSIPGYSSSLKLIENLTREYFQNKSFCYDLGCSLGASTACLIKAIENREGKVHAIDNSKAMISSCNDKFNHFIDSQKVIFSKKDIETAEIKDASIVVINFVLQFIKSSRRESLLKKVFSGMKKNGLLILSEKTHFDNKFRNQTLLNLHHQFKFNNGYTKMEISRKRDALEGVLITDLEKDHFQRLQKIGYTEIKKVMSNLNFFTLIAQKK